MNDYIATLASHPQLLAHAKELEVREMRSFLWRNILRLLGLDYTNPIEVSGYYSSPQFLVELENVLQEIFPRIHKIAVEKIPSKVIFICEPEEGDEIIIVASWFTDKPDPAS